MSIQLTKTKLNEIILYFSKQERVFCNEEQFRLALCVELMKMPELGGEVRVECVSKDKGSPVFLTIPKDARNPEKWKPTL